MPWVRLDEEFPDHPKVVTAGPLAGWLHVCALAYCNRHLTDGFVPRAQVPRLANFEGMLVDYEGDDYDARTAHEPTPQEMAEVLVEVGMWEERQGGFFIHDFLDFQPSRAEVQAQRKVKSDAGRAGGVRSGASRRSKPEPEAKQTTKQNGTKPEAQSKQTGSKSEAEPEAKGQAKSKPVPVPGTDTSSSSSDLRPPAKPPDDDDGLAKAIEARVEAQLQERQSPAVVAKKGQVGDVAAWKAGARKRARAEVAEQGRSVLRPPAKAADPMERTAAARREHAERNDAYARGEACETCEGQGFVLDDDVVAVECAACRARPKAVGE